LLTRDYWVKASFGEGYGGVITFISKASVPSEDSIVDSVLVVGRALKVQINGDDSKLVVYNTHNFDLQGQALSDFCSSVSIDVDRSRASPYELCMFLLGDLNLTPRAGQLFEYGSPAVAMDTANSRPPARGPLLRVLEQLTEVESAVPTRYNTEADTGTIIDRVFTSLPAHVFTLCKVTHSVEQDPRDLYKSGLSDHAPVVVSFYLKHRCLLERALYPLIFSGTGRFATF